MACGCNARHKRESLTAWQKPTHKHIANAARDRRQQLRHSLAWLNGKPHQRTVGADVRMERWPSHTTVETFAIQSAMVLRPKINAAHTRALDQLKF